MKWLSRIFPIHSVYSKSLFSSLFLTLIFSSFISFFYLFRSENQTQFYSALFWVFFISILYFLILRTGQVSRYRSVFFITFAFFFIISFMSGLLETRGNFLLTKENIANLELPMCHIVIPQTLLPIILDGNVIFPTKMYGASATFLTMIGIWLLMSFTIGKGWCSWACFYGGCDEGFSKVGGRKKRLNIDKIKILKYLPFAMLLLVILGSLFSYFTLYCQGFCPFKTTTEFPKITDIKSMALTFLFLGLFITFVVILPILSKKRTQCGLLCPFGAFESIFNKTTLFRIRINRNECISCQKCINECPTFSMSEESLKNGKPGITCTRCGKCIDICPKSAINYHLLGVPFTQKNRVFTKKKNDSPFSNWFRSKLNEILDPRVFFISTALLFGSIIASGYFIKGLLRIIQFIKTGSLILQ